MVVASVGGGCVGKGLVPLSYFQWSDVTSIPTKIKIREETGEKLWKRRTINKSRLDLVQTEKC